MKKYETERDGQLEFFRNFRIDFENNQVLIDNTDGVWNGNLFEFKLNIDNLNKVLFQAIKYLSRMRIKGESIPANILLVSLNTHTLYLYRSQEYFDEIHKVYYGAASKDNDNFVAKTYAAKYDYLNMVDSIKVLDLLKTNDYMPIRLDEDCIVGWAERYYQELPTANKGDFLGDDTGKVKIIGEIREPKHFKGLILPYEGKTNEKFKYLMDKLNDRLKKKDLGAFYTPIPYAEKAAELVRMAINRVPDGNDYIILDRCAGTGNLEAVLTEEELSHCILSTYEYYEYKVLVERLGDKVRCIIPPTEAHVEYQNGCIINADAMSEEYINNPIINSYLQNPKCTIILYENPPYRDITASDKVDIKNKSFIYNEFVKHGTNQASHRDISNLFIWSAFKYYLRQSTDSYIVFSPVKYFKVGNMTPYRMICGNLFNRKHFHASPSAISCVLWSNEFSNIQRWELDAYDIVDNEIVYVGTQTIKKVYNSISDYSDHRVSCEDIATNVVCGSDGLPTIYNSESGKMPVYNSNIIAYLEAQAFPLNAMNRCMVRCNWKNGIEQSKGFHLRTDVYLTKLPLWAAKIFPENNWFEKDVYFTTSDGGDKYIKDKEFLKSCLIYTCLSNQNKCLSFKGSDNRNYQNELCFDDGALALKDLNSMVLNDDEKELMLLWDKILQEAKQTKNYDNYWKYGVYQITKELNTFTEIGTGKSKKIYDYPELNGDLNTLRVKLKEYYKKYITPKMLDYELVK